MEVEIILVNVDLQKIIMDKDKRSMDIFTIYLSTPNNPHPDIGEVLSNILLSFLT